MTPSRFFHHVQRRSTGHSSEVPANADGLTRLLAECVVEPFERAMGMAVIVVPMIDAQADDAEEPLPNPCHPACAEFANTNYCRESWQLHVAEAQRRPEAHWHTCEFGMFCAMIPVVCQGRCVAAIKLACPASISEEDFDQHVALLDILVESFVVLHTDFLSKLVCTQQATADLGFMRLNEDQDAGPPTAGHSQVEQAIRFIVAHFCDSGLTVAGVARHLGLHTNHLCHLFAEQTGRRMSRFIADRRIEKAKSLLATTNHQIKRISHDTGHAHPNWFSHMFTLHTGMTPGEYRKKARGENSG